MTIWLEIEELKAKKLWQDKFGSIVPIKDLEHRHLSNVIQWLEHHAESMRIKTAYDSDGDERQEIFDMSNKDYLYQYTVYPELLEEAKRRGIK